MKLSKNFSLREFTRSDSAERAGIDNTPNEEHLRNLYALAAHLEQVRAALGGKGIHITSGYRCKDLNELVGGVPNSAHSTGLAADITVPGMHPISVAREIQDSQIIYDQLIYEASRGVVHISFEPSLRGETKSQAGGPGTSVTWGINR